MGNNLSLTIGPVYKTLKQARSVREIWAASYFFSALMREILKAAETSFGTAISPTLLPDTAHRFGAGIYPDRAFWLIESPEKKDKIAVIVDDAIKQVSQKFGIPTKEIEDYAYFYGHLMANGQNILAQTSKILAANKVLDDLELEEYIHNPPKDILDSLVSGIQKLYNDGHKQSQDSIFVSYSCKGSDLRRLPSLLEIATRDMKLINRPDYNRVVTQPINDRVCQLINENRNEYNNAELEEQDVTIQRLKAVFEKEFKFRHKYVAFIKADGDYMGTTLGLLQDETEKINQFSKLLSTFAGEAVKAIHAYGGLPIYAGGDDLLFTLPLANSNADSINQSGRNIFELIDKIDTLFPSDSFSDLIDGKYRPTMSYGISFCYYKYPMDEILGATEAALNDHAKKHPGKNAVSFSLRKHSGQTVSATFGKSAAYAHFNSMLIKYRSFDDEAFLSGLMYKLDNLHLLLVDAIINGRLEYLFKNQFNEDGHTGKYKTVLEDARNLFNMFYAENKGNNNALSHEELAGKSINQLFACLRFIQFFNQDDHE